jgi:hypothetical protein
MISRITTGKEVEELASPVPCAPEQRIACSLTLRLYIRQRSRRRCSDFPLTESGPAFNFVQRVQRERSDNT